ncbi:hypothetical protein WN51_05663 [Melipona quadrifasciata]|uniref:Uncharacterized protein n=1 Tax=Melipona quadrifasciata TaxID=166423 RepID=A0A0M8ZST0_9HYME|nr:hypothetical protein WN51_05663 [Melipona quadrifasciata]
MEIGRRRLECLNEKEMGERDKGKNRSEEERVTKLVKVRKGRMGSSEIDLEKWCKRRVEVEKEVEKMGVDGTKEVGTPKQGENEAEQKEERMADVEKIKKMIQEMELQQQEMMKGLRDVVERILARIGEKEELEDREQKRGIITKRYKPKGDKERLEDNLTEKEKKMQRQLRKIAVIERKKGKRIWFKYSKIQTDDVWWRWDEEEKVLKTWRGIRRMEGKQNEKEKGR